MKKLFLSITLLAAVIFSQAQQSVGSKADIDRFFRTTTYVVLENNPMLQYNRIIKETVEKHWKLTPVEFVTYSTDEFEKARFDTTKSFLMMNRFSYNKDKVKTQYIFLTVQLGGNYEFVRQMPEIAGVPIAYEDVEEETYAHKLGMLCLFLQNHITLTRDNSNLNPKNIIKHYYKSMTADIHDKTLYLTKEDLAKNFSNANQIKQTYQYNYKIVSREDIQAAIDNKDQNVVFIHKVGPEGTKRKARCFKTIVGAADARLYYFSWHMIDDKKPEGFLKSDWKKIAKAKKKN